MKLKETEINWRNNVFTFKSFECSLPATLMGFSKQMRSASMYGDEFHIKILMKSYNYNFSKYLAGSFGG